MKAGFLYIQTFKSRESAKYWFTILTLGLTQVHICTNISMLTLKQTDFSFVAK